MTKKSAKASRKKPARSKTAKRKRTVKGGASKKAARKKTGRPKGSTKKGVKKKTGKKKGVKNTGGIPRKIKPKPCIRITNSVASEPKRTLRKSTKDTICWIAVDQDYTLTFLDGWPFLEGADDGYRSVDVTLGAPPRNFTVDPSASEREYEYSISPPAEEEIKPNPIVDVSGG